MSEAAEAQMRKRLEKLLDAPKDRPIVIDKGHDAPLYAKEQEPVGDERDGEKNRLTGRSRNTT